MFAADSPGAPQHHFTGKLEAPSILAGTLLIPVLWLTGRELGLRKERVVRRCVHLHHTACLRPVEHVGRR